MTTEEASWRLKNRVKELEQALRSINPNNRTLKDTTWVYIEKPEGQK